jgi:hypothetical protein
MMTPMDVRKRILGANRHEKLYLIYIHIYIYINMYIYVYINMYVLYLSIEMTMVRFYSKINNYINEC